MRVKEGNKEKDILEAAIKVFADYGYHKAKISKIAELANVATGSVYIYFKNKESILLQIFEKLWQKLFVELKSVAENTAISPIEKIDAMIDLVFDIFTENPSLAVVFVNEQNHLIQSTNQKFTKYYDMFLDQGELVIKEGIKQNLFDPNIDLSVFRHFIFGALRNLLHLWAKDQNKYSLNKIRRNVKFLIKHGIQK
ncbi:TetR/AcrR family transcriptional regulator [Melioribacteraceae bacterium 4301-Me]|uniref:TetR/AcrR family transcriptional regulator n=1 Tax=Pyranulibacter aquaticus TaxID=3163344 RepID=UPI003595E802